MNDLTFTPQTDDELIDLLSEGYGSFEVLSSEALKSKNENPMIKLVLKVWDKNGSTQNIFDYLLLTDKNFSKRKIKHFCMCVGLDDKYNAGGLNAIDCLGKSGNLEIKTQHDKDGKYPPKSIVFDYLKKIDSTEENKGLNDDIPF